MIFHDLVTTTDELSKTRKRKPNMIFHDLVT
ncbi:MAG: hypothetical protein ACI86M_003077, partial [Saprospiraceae bacterium]